VSETLLDAELSMRALGVLCTYMGCSEEDVYQRDSLYGPSWNSRRLLCEQISLDAVIAKLAQDQSLNDLKSQYNCGKLTLAEIRGYFRKAIERITSIADYDISDPESVKAWSRRILAEVDPGGSRAWEDQRKARVFLADAAWLEERMKATWVAAFMGRPLDWYLCQLGDA
jgi:hypothetical protein